MPQLQKLEKTPAFLKAMDLFENSRRHIFLTGRAGTGKSTLLQHFRTSTTKNVAVLAPTGVAAVNIAGQTIHSFFCFRPDVTPSTVGDIRLRKSQREIYQKTDTIIIDEISMVRSDLMDCMDAFLRIHGPDTSRSFGGIRMIMIGDLYQLPPVVVRQEREAFAGLYASPYFFDAKAFPEMDMEFLELDTIWRQKEDRFINLLNAIRSNMVTANDMALLNSRVVSGFEPSGDEFYVYLTTTNDQADEINRERLTALKGRKFDYQGIANGRFDTRSLPTQEAMSVKIGAQVMLLNNDSLGRWVNGSIGVVLDIIHTDNDDAIRIKLSGGEVVDVVPHTWEMFRFVFDEATERLQSEVVGSFTQYPLRLAWAVTIHKAQGKTFDRVVIDIGRGAFSHGQVYVALSRCRTLSGVTLLRPIFKHHIILDPRVKRFLDSVKVRMTEEESRVNVLDSAF